MKKWTPYLLLSPLFLLGLLFVWGIVNALIQSLGYIPALGMTDFTIKYYAEIFTNERIFASIKVSLYIAIVSSILATVLGVLLCAALVITGKGLGRVLQIIRLPILTPHTVVALFVMMILSQNGLLARALYNMNLLETQGDFPALLFAPGGAGIIIAYMWKEIPFIAYFVLPVMASISKRLGEAAENLGAPPIRSFFNVTLPLCLPAIHKAFLIVLAFSFGAYELPFLLGATVPKALPVQAYIEYMSPELRHRPYAMAMNGVMLLISFAIAFLYYWLCVRKSKINGDYHGI